MVDDAGGHEQRRLEGRVVENMENRSHRSQRAIEAEQQGDQAQVADGRIGQQALEVILKDGRVGAENQRAGTRATDDPEPLLGAGQRRPHARHEKHPGLDHGRRVQIRRHRRGGRHSVRQPEMERELGAFGQCADQNQGE